MSLDINFYDGRDEVAWHNITHNLGKMAKAAGLYRTLWRFEESGFKKAKDITDIMERGVGRLKAYPDFFKQFDSENGWGIYEHFVSFCEDVLADCKKYPEADIETGR